MRTSAKALFGSGRNKELLKLYISEVIMLQEKARKKQEKLQKAA